MAQVRIYFFMEFIDVLNPNNIHERGKSDGNKFLNISNLEYVFQRVFLYYSLKNLSI